MLRLLKLVGLFAILLGSISGAGIASANYSSSAAVQASSTSLNALQAVKVDKNHHAHLRGRVVSIDPGSISFDSAKGVHYVAKTEATTRYIGEGKATIDRSAIKVGSAIRVSGVLDPDGHTITAKVVRLFSDLNHARLGGKIVSIDGNVITMAVHHAAKPGKTPTKWQTETTRVVVAADAKITLDGKPSTLSELKAGDRVNVAGVINNDGSFTAHKVHGHTPEVHKTK